MATLLVCGFKRVDDGLCFLGEKQRWEIVGGRTLGVAVRDVDSGRGGGWGTVGVAGVVGGHEQAVYGGAG